MFCHVPDAEGAWAVVSSVVTSSFRTGARSILSRFPGFAYSAWGPSSRSLFDPFSPPPAFPGGGTLFRAYRARAGAPVGAGTVRAPDCARARGKRRTHVSCRLPPGLFCGPSRFPAQKSRKAAPEGRLSVPILTHFLSGQAPQGNCSEIREQDTAISGLSRNAVPSAQRPFQTEKAAPKGRLSSICSLSSFS